MDNNVIQTDIDRNSFLHLLSDYFSKKNDKKIDVKMDLTLEYKKIDNIDNYYDSIIKSDFFYVEESKHERTYLNKNDLEEALSYYVNQKDCLFDSFKYVGGIRHVGYYVDEDTPYFEGIRVFLKEKNDIKKMIKKK